MVKLDIALSASKTIRYERGFGNGGHSYFQNVSNEMMIFNAVSEPSISAAIVMFWRV